MGAVFDVLVLVDYAEDSICAVDKGWLDCLESQLTSVAVNDSSAQEVIHDRRAPRLPLGYGVDEAFPATVALDYGHSCRPVTPIPSPCSLSRRCHYRLITLESMAKFPGWASSNNVYLGGVSFHMATVVAICTILTIVIAYRQR
jgi:hypothetical protein